ncbi:hypothetical protein [Streptosporangium lutulentum]|uniref:Uncharacterized protein n=1 Tax=Streptosporangium lutulentum TaxID=1461250 RepID=A0ABT9QUK6_9ACTN|nr:hypothetical protein [Streptosporangium lutulentum]MDP9850451.1 hypothetical protein [Streptosporangium lutulentum]
MGNGSTVASTREELLSGLEQVASDTPASQDSNGAGPAAVGRPC